jgi:hypothetical protein
MAALSVQRPSVAGVAQTMATAAAGGDTVANDEKVFLRVTNGHGSASRTVTIDAPGTCDHGLAANAAHDAVVTIAAGVTKIIGPFPIKRFGETLAISYSDSAADLTIAAFSKD